MIRALSLFAVLVLSACQGTGLADETPRSDDTCGAEAFRVTLGQPREVLDGRVLPEGTRLLPPGSAMTMDFRPDRLNIDIDAQGRISRIWCG